MNSYNNQINEKQITSLLCSEIASIQNPNNPSNIYIFPHIDELVEVFIMFLKFSCGEEIIEDIDESIIEELDKDVAREIINALEEGDEVRVSFFDREEKTAVNCIGALIKKFSDEHFIILATQVNTVHLKSPYEIELNLQKNAILDIQII